jgi:hypothetical protein
MRGGEVERGADIAGDLIQLPYGRQKIGPDQVRCDPGNPSRDDPRMRPPDRLRLTGFVALLRGELPDHVEQPEP